MSFLYGSKFELNQKGKQKIQLFFFLVTIKIWSFVMYITCNTFQRMFTKNLCHIRSSESHKYIASILHQQQKNQSDEGSQRGREGGRNGGKERREGEGNRVSKSTNKQILFLIIRALYFSWGHKANPCKSQETMLAYRDMIKSRMLEIHKCPSSSKNGELGWSGKIVCNVNEAQQEG